MQSVDLYEPNMNQLLPFPNIDPVTVLLFWTILSSLYELHDDDTYLVIFPNC